MKDNLKTDEFECPNCGAKVEFDPKSQTLLCSYCNTQVKVNSDENASERQLQELLVNTTVWSDTEVIVCQNCGSKEVISKGEISSKCSFCGTNNVIKTSEIVGMKPHGVCPFEKTITDAEEAVREWKKKKRFLPNSFKKLDTMSAIKGVYVPAFSFDSSTETKYNGRLGERESYTVRRNGKTETRTTTRYFNISGDYDRKFDDLLVYATDKIPPVMLTELEPFPTTKSIVYDAKYLAGYTASTYTIDGKKAWENCQTRASQELREEILSKYRHDVVDYFNAETSYFNTSFKYLLLPVYVGHHSYKNKNYNFYVNGSTGKVSGNAPKSGWKIFFFILGIIGVIALPILLSILGVLD